MRKNIVLAGVGGQGVMTLSRVLGETLLRKGFEVRIGEVHGLSQRGGSVLVHLRYGDRVYAPTVPPGGGDVLVALEMIEAARRLVYLKPGGTVLANSLVLPPPMSGEPPSLEELGRAIKAAGAKLLLIDGSGIAERAGSPLALNMAMLGALLATGEVDVGIGEVEEELERRFSGKLLEINLAALRGAYEEMRRRGKA